MDVSNIFKSKTRIAIFRLYFTNSDQAYYLRELERLLDIPVSMIRKELVHLESTGIFISTRQGNLTYFHLNKKYPLYEELKSIVFKTIGVSGLLKDTLQKFQGIILAFIYGSYAKSAEHAISDIDVFILSKAIDEDKLISKMRKLEKMLKREINYHLYSPADFKHKLRKPDSFIREVMKNPKVFLIGDENVIQKIS
jgi:predicted nucleotidyltransferase